MGMSSLLEDIQKARDDAIHFQRLLIANSGLDGPVQRLAEQARKEIPGYLEILDRTIAHFNRILEIATDPSMDLAEEIIRLKEEFAVLKSDHQTRVQQFQNEIDALKNASASSKRNFREELKARDELQKKKISEITKAHVRELENQTRAHQIEKNGWKKELEKREQRSSSLVATGIEKHKPRTKVMKLDFATELQAFEPKDKDVR